MTWHGRALLLAGLTGLCNLSTAAQPAIAHPQGGSLVLERAGLPAAAQLALIPGGPYRKAEVALKNPALALAGDGRYAYAGGAGGLSVFDLSAAPPRLLAQLPTAGHITHIALGEGMAYLADAGGALRIVDVSNPQRPQLAGSHALAAAPAALSVAQGRAYLVSGKQLLILDVGLAQAPQLLAAYDLAGAAGALQVADGYAYLAMPQSGLTILDVRDATRIRAAGSFRGSVRDVAVAQGRAYLANGATGLTVLDVSAPQTPRWLGSVHHLGNSVAVRHDERSVAVRNDRNEIFLVDVNNPQLPALASSYRAGHALNAMTLMQRQVLAGSDAALEVIAFSAPAPDAVNLGANFGGSRRAVIRDGILYVADWFSGLHLYDISAPRAPRHLSAYHTQGSPKGVAVRGDYAYLADDDHGVQIIDVSDPRAPRKLSEVATPGLAYTMQLAGDYLYLADHRGGFHVISVADPARPTIVGSAPTAGKAWAVAIRDRIAYVAADRAGLLLFDIGDPQHPSQIGAVEIGGAAEDVVLRDDTAYVANFDLGLFVFDISNPALPRQIAHLATPGNARGIELAGRYAYVADWVAGIQVVDVGDPARPAAVGAYDSDGWAWGVRVQDRYAYLLDWWGGIAVLDVSDPAAPTLAGAYHARGVTRDIALQDNYAYVAYGANGLQIFDVKNPLNPIWISAVDVQGEAQSVSLDGGSAYLAAGSNGVIAVDVSYPFQPKLRANYDVPADAVRAQGGWLYAAQRGRGVALIDTASGRQSAWYAAALEDLWLDAGRLWLATAHGIETIDVGDPAHPRLVRRWTRRADLLRVQNDILATYAKSGGITLYRYRNGRLQAAGRFNPGEDIFDIELADDRLYASGSRSGLLVLDIADAKRPKLLAAYPAAAGVGKFGVFAGTAFMAGNELLTGVRLLPQSAVTAMKNARLKIELPAQLPLGSYHLLALDARSGRRELRYDALRVELPAPKKPRFTMQDFERAMRERGLTPAPRQ